MNSLTLQEVQLIRQIKHETAKKNMDNISRTDAYFSYFKNNPDIIWAFLASMVSRNGGWNMCDLKGSIFPKVVEAKARKTLFITYERANWLIFHDVFPQLLLYQYSTKLNKPLFHLLHYFHVSEFIQKEWVRYWKESDQKRMTTALIINEQNVIQKPVIEHPFYKNKVFWSPLFFVQDWFHFSCVLFPTLGGEVYGASVNGFRSLSKRIDLGKRLASILFHPRLFPYFFEFAERTTHTGSRNDYEQYFRKKIDRITPMLRTSFPVIKHHQDDYEDWSLKRRIRHSWLHTSAKHHHPIHLTDWYFQKNYQLELMVSLKNVFQLHKWK